MMMSAMSAMKRRRKQVKKPANENREPPVPRKCLMCNMDFSSSWIGERVCPRCKESVSWKEGY